MHFLVLGSAGMLGCDTVESGGCLNCFNTEQMLGGQGYKITVSSVS